MLSYLGMCRHGRCNFSEGQTNKPAGGKTRTVLFKANYLNIEQEASLEHAGNRGRRSAAPVMLIALGLGWAYAKRENT